MHQLINNSQLRLLDDCGHFSVLEKPYEVNAALRDWYLGGSVA
jgi:pimeloyl-ACP methyl ester carboxylesterase